MRKIQPVFKPRVWGGSYISARFEEAPGGTAIGEAWLLSGHPAGETRDELGRTLPTDSRTGHWFPVLIKLLHANADLSVQVHPNDDQARSVGDLGKTEGWLILDAQPGARICYGHTLDSPAELRQALQEGRMEEFLRYVKVKPGDYFPVPPGTVHALGAGIVALEVQQASDTTYRLYDYGRLENGKPRTLHIEEGIAVTAFPQPELPTMHPDRAGFFSHGSGTLYGAAHSEWRADSALTVYDDNPFFGFAALTVDGHWHADDSGRDSSTMFCVIALDGDVKPHSLPHRAQPYDPWLFEPGEEVYLVGSGRVALVSIPFSDTRG